MDETTATLPQLLSRQEQLSRDMGPESRIAFALGHMIGRVAIGPLIEEQKAQIEEWHYIATHDDLVTEALNRRGLQEYLDSAGMPKAAIYTDANNFKAINDTLGHDRGDQVIKDTHQKLKKSVREGDQIVRVGGDEYVILLNDRAAEAISPDHPMANEYKQREQSAVEHIAEIKRRIAEEVETYLNENPDLKAVSFDLAVGAAMWEGESADNLIKKAEAAAMRRKKEQHEAGGKYERPAAD